MHQPSLSTLPSSEGGLYRTLLTLCFAAFPLFALTTATGHRLVAILLLLVAIVALIRKYGEWNPSLSCFAGALALLTGPYYLAFLFGELQSPSMERVSYGWLFLFPAAAACALKPNRSVFIGALIIGAYASLVAQLISGGERPSLIFNPIPFAEVAAVFFCLLCVCVGKMKKPWMGVALIAGLIGWAAVIALTQTRGAVLSMLPGVAYLLIYCTRRFGKRISLAAFVILVATAWVGDSLSGNLVSKRFELALNDIRQYQQEPEQFSSTAVRFELWRGALMVASEHPLGLGEEKARQTALQWSEEGKLQSYVQPQLKIAHFHSDYLQHLAIAGYPGLIGLLLFYGLLLGYFGLRRHKIEGAMGLVVTLSYIIAGLTDVPLYHRLTLFTLFIVLTLCFVGVSRSKEPQQPALQRASAA